MLLPPRGMNPQILRVYPEAGNDFVDFSGRVFLVKTIRRWKTPFG